LSELIVFHRHADRQLRVLWLGRIWHILVLGVGVRNHADILGLGPSKYVVDHGEDALLDVWLAVHHVPVILVIGFKFEIFLLKVQLISGNDKAFIGDIVSNWALVLESIDW
jgi:hypothetical protein